MCGDHCTVIDILFFCEIYQLSKHYKQPPNHYAKLMNWFDEIKKIEEVNQVCGEFD